MGAILLTLCLLSRRFTYQPMHGIVKRSLYVANVNIVFVGCNGCDEVAMRSSFAVVGLLGRVLQVALEGGVGLGNVEHAMVEELILTPIN